MKKSVLKTTIALVLAVLLTVPTIFANSTPVAALPTIDTTAGSSQNQLVSRILGLIQFVAISIALGMLIIIGIQYVTATGEKKGQIKDTAINYLFGAVCIFAAAAILGGIRSLVSTIQA